MRRRLLRKNSAAKANAMAPRPLDRRVAEHEQPEASELDATALLAAPEALIDPPAPAVGAPAAPAAPLELELPPAALRPDEPPPGEPALDEPPLDEPPLDEPEPPGDDEPPCAEAPPALRAPPMPPLPPAPVGAIGPTPTEKAIVGPDAPMS